MNDGALAEMLAELDAELARRKDPWPTARVVLDHVETGSPGAIERYAARRQLERVGCTIHSTSW